MGQGSKHKNTPRSGDDSIIIGHGPDQLAVLAAEDGGANGVAEAADSLGELDLGLPDVLAESLELVDVEGGAACHGRTSVDAGLKIDNSRLEGQAEGDPGHGGGQSRGCGGLSVHASYKSRLAYCQVGSCIRRDCRKARVSIGLFTYLAAGQTPGRREV